MNDFDELSKYIAKVESTIDAWIAKLGLGYNHFAVLYSLASAENGQCTQKQICEEWLLPKQTTFNVCKEYKEKGWIEFSESPTDKREKLMRLTEAGKAKTEPVWQATQELSQKTFAAFGKKNTGQLFALLEEFSEVCRQQIERAEVKKDTIP